MEGHSTKEHCLLDITRYRDPEGNPTCAGHFQTGEVCTFYCTAVFGTQETCVFSKAHETLGRRLDTKTGSLIPLPQCPVWNRGLGTGMAINYDLKRNNKPTKEGYYLRLPEGGPFPMFVKIIPSVNGKSLDILSHSLCRALSKEPKTTLWSDAMDFSQPIDKGE